MNETNITRTTFEVPEQNFEKLTAKLEKLNRRALKLGCAPIEFSVTGSVLTYRWDKAIIANRHSDSSLWLRDVETGEKARFDRFEFVKTGEVRTILFVSVVGQAPKYAGWTFAATVALSEGGNILRKSPSCKVELTQFRDCKPACEHCNTERNRRDTFVLLHDSGALKQVGRQCLRDFLGHQSPEVLAAQAEWLFSVEEACSEAEELEEGGSGHHVRQISLEIFLQHAAEFTLSFGFLSRKAVQERQEGCSTADEAIANLFPPRNVTPRVVTPEAVELAVKAQAYVLANLTGDLNDFQHNLLTVAKCECIDFRSTGIAAYLVEFYRREVEVTERRAKLATESKHFGEAGTRYKKQAATYLGSNSFESNFGTCFFHRFSTEDGALLVWKTGTSLSEAQGSAQVITFTVKAHSDYKGQKQTEISRVIFS